MIFETMVYPFSKEFINELIFLLKHDNIHIKRVVSPNGLALAGKDAGTACHMGKIDTIVNNQFYDSITDCNAVLFTSCSNIDKKLIIKKIEFAINKKKHILCCIPLEKNEIEHIELECEKNGLIFQYYIEDQIEPSYDLKYLQEINTPIIFVGQLINKIDSWCTLLGLVSEFRMNGYKVSAIGNKQNCKLMDIHCMPKLIDNFMDVEKTVCYINNYVKTIEDIEKPDVFIIQMPGGLMKFNDNYYNDFGLYSYLLAQSIQADYVSISIPFNLFKEPNSINDFNKMISNKFNINVNNFVRSNIIIDFEGEDTKIIPTIPEKFNLIKSNNFIYNYFETKELYNNIIKTLTV